MSNIIKVFAVLALCGMAFTVAGCGQTEPNVPNTPAERIKAIEANPSFTDEQKARYKLQVEENEKLQALANKMAPPSPPPAKP